MRCLVTGGTGFVGRHLVRHLDRPVVLGRDKNKIIKICGDVIPCKWEPEHPLDKNLLEGVETVFHLAGESVSKGRWNKAKKKRIMHSRVDGTRSLVQALGALDKPPATLVCASAIGYYGSRGEELLTETSSSGNDFLARVCRAWEEEARQAENFGIRVVSVRVGIVLGRDGGALPLMLLPFKLGIGGRLGNGKQYMSWIHIDDLVNIFLFVARHPEIRGPVNGVVPYPSTNRDFTATLASVLHRPAFLHVPGVVLKAALGEFGEVLLSSQKVVPEKIIGAGYDFKYPTLKNGLQNLIT